MHESTITGEIFSYRVLHVLNTDFQIVIILGQNHCRLHRVLCEYILRQEFKTVLMGFILNFWPNRLNTQLQWFKWIGLRVNWLIFHGWAWGIDQASLPPPYREKSDITSPLCIKTQNCVVWLLHTHCTCNIQFYSLMLKFSLRQLKCFAAFCLF